MLDLIVKTSKYALVRLTMVVLNEYGVRNELIKFLLIKGLEEKAT